MTDNDIIKALEWCSQLRFCGDCPMCKEGYCSHTRNACRAALIGNALDLINRQKADKERLEIELQEMRNAANSYKSKAKSLEMDNAQLHSDIINANQNFDHIKGLWEAEKEKVEKAKQKVINVCKELQTAKAEIEGERE